MTPDNDSLPQEVDEIFLALMCQHGVDMKLLSHEMRGKFSSGYYPWRQIKGVRLTCVPPDAPQFKGYVSKKGQAWFDHLYLDADKGRRSYMTSRVSDTVIVLDRHYGVDVVEGIPIGKILGLTAISDAIIVKEIKRLYSGEDQCLACLVTDPGRLPIDAIVTLPSAPASPHDVIANDNLERFLSLTHQRTEPWTETNFGWRRDGVRLPDTEVVRIERTQHHTPGIAKPLEVLSMSASYDPIKAQAVGPVLMTFFDRRTNTWRLPMAASAEHIGNVLRVWSLVILPDGTFLRSRI